MDDRCHINEHPIEEEWKLTPRTLVHGFRRNLHGDEARAGRTDDRFPGTFKPLKGNLPIGSDIDAFALLCLVLRGEGFGNELEPCASVFDEK